jgi:hypothetical protein
MSDSATYDASEHLRKLRDEERAENERIDSVLGDTREAISEAAWHGAVNWLRNSQGDLAYDGGPDDAQAEWEHAVCSAAQSAVVAEGYDLSEPAVMSVVISTAIDVKAENAVATSYGAFGGGSEDAAIAKALYGERPITSRSTRGEIEERCAEWFPDEPTLEEDEARFERTQDWLVQAGYRDSQATFRPYTALVHRFECPIFDNLEEPLPRELWNSAIKALKGEGLYELHLALNETFDAAKATSLLDRVAAFDQSAGRATYYSCRVVRRKHGGLRLILQLHASPAHLSAALGRRRRLQFVLVQRRGARDRTHSGRNNHRVGGSRRSSACSRLPGGDDPDPEPGPALGRPPGAVLL